MRWLVTGAAGLVGSEFCRQVLARGDEVFAVDNLSLGTRRHLEEFSSQKGFAFEPWDVSQRGWHQDLIGKNFDACMHLAANSDISLGHERPSMECERTFSTTFETLLAVKELKIKNILFSSTSAVYGSSPEFPTPEDTGNLHPVSMYGAAKLASESFISAFVENFGVNAWVYRFGNVVGRKLTHGVIFDFVKKLQKDPSALAVLGNGKQNKTYIDVTDCVTGILYGFSKSVAGKTHRERFQIFNLSTVGTTSVSEIAEETVRVVTGGKAKIAYGTSDVGWIGDVAKTSLKVERMTKLGWAPKLDSKKAVFESIKNYYDWARA